ncbi:putative reverse transcriptase domain-containing protein, partial [Tanacetum coccineum]
RLYDDSCDKEDGSYELKYFDAYSIGTTLLDDALPPKEKVLNCDPKGIAENVLVGIDKFVFPVDFIVLDMLEDIKTPLILGKPFLSTAHAKIDVFKRKITLRVGNDKILFKSDKPTSNIIKRVYALSLRERMELDLEDKLIGEALILNRSLDPLYEEYIELNDLNEPLELSEYPSYCDFDRKVHIDCAYNLKFSCMIGYEHVNASFFPLLSIYLMSKNFYNSIMKDKIDYKGKNVVGAFMNVSIFVANFSVVTDFVVVKNIDSYRDEGMGDIIIGRPFCKDACIKAIGFDGMITIYKGNNSVTYQMARSHLSYAKRHAFWSLNEEISRIVLSSDYLYAVSNKEDTAYLCLHFTRNHEELKSNTSSLFTFGPAWDWLTFQKHPGDSVPSVFKASMLHIPGWKSKFIFVCEDLFSDQNPGIVTPFRHRLGTFPFPFPS